MRAAPRYDADRHDRVGAVGASVEARALVVADTGNWPSDRSFVFIMGTASLLWIAMYRAALTLI